MNEKKKNNKIISLVVPIYNEMVMLPIFLERITSVIDSINNYQFEIIFVNDGSNDDSLVFLKNYIENDKRLVVIELSKNFGKESALTAGIDTAIGNAVIPIDVDLQDPPELISEMLKKWENGAEIVEAKRINRTNDSFLKRFSAKIFYFTLNLISKDKIPSNVGDFRLIDRVVVNNIKILKERNRFMKGIFSWPGFNVDVIEYTRNPRPSGSTKFNYFKLISLAIEGITSFSIAPLKFITLVGFLGTIFSFFFMIVILIQKFFLLDFVVGYAFLVLIILFFGSLQLLSIGVLGEYIGKIYLEAKQRPIYIIKNIFKNN